MKLDKKEVERHLVEKKHKPSGESIRNIVFGASDGIVTTLALVAAVTGATAEISIIIIAGLAGAFSSAISMGLGNYISLKSEIELYKSSIDREKQEIKKNPEYEKEEVRQIYAAKGFSKPEQNIAVKRISANKKRFLDFMIQEELGLGESNFESPVKAGITIGIADIIAALIPVTPYFFLSRLTALYTAIIGSMLLLFGVGVFKTRFTGRSWLKSGLETMIIGAIATLVSYYLGNFVSSF